MVINHDIKNKAKAARYLLVYADYMQSDVGQSKAVRYLQVYGGICRHMRVRQMPSDICSPVRLPAG